MNIVYLFILLAVLMVILVYIDKKSVQKTEHFTMNSMPANFIVQADDQFECFYNGQQVSSGSGWNQTFRFTINGVSSGSKIYFGVTNYSGPGSLRVQFTYGSQTYYSDQFNVRCLGKQPTPNGQIIGNRYMGCFRDGGSRDLPLYVGYMSSDQCMMTAVNQNVPYYGLQYGGQCFLGNSYGRYGSADNCNMGCYTNGQELCGGNWANQVYSINQAPETTVVSSQNNPAFDSRAKALWVNTGDNGIGRYLFELTMPNTDKLEFCPNPDYDEFNPAGCLNARTTANCSSSVLPNYIALDQKCGRLYNKEDQDKFYMIMNKLFKFVYTIDQSESKTTKTIETTGEMNTNSGGNNCLLYNTNTSKIKTQIKMTDKAFMNRLKAKSLAPPKQGYSSGSLYLNEFLQTNFRMLELLKIIGDKIKYPMDPKQMIEEQIVLPDSPLYYALVKESLRYSKNHRDQLSQLFTDSYNKTYLLARIIVGTPTISAECNCLGLSFEGTQQCVPC